MKFFNYIQATPAITWTITHNFGQKAVADTWVTVNGTATKILPKKITNVDNNTLMIEFSIARAGGARLAASPFEYQQIGASGTALVGVFATATSSASIPTTQTLQTVNPPSMDGIYAIGSWNAADSFNTNNGNLTGRQVETYTAPASQPSRTLVWSSGGTPDSTVGGGAMLLGSTNNGAFPAVNDNGEFSNPTGMYIEFKYASNDIGTSVIVGFNLGNTNVSIVANDQSGPGYGGAQSIRIDASGFNGYTDSSGALLPAPVDGLTFSESFTLDRYFSTPIDARNKVIRAELTTTSFKLLVDGAIVLQQTPRWPVKFFSSAVVNQLYTNDFANMSIFRSNVESQTTVDYMKVGAL